MEALESDITETGAGELVYGTRVVRIDRVQSSGSKRGDGSEDGWVVQMVSKDAEPTAVLAKVVVNAAGLKYVRHFFRHSVTDLDCSARAIYNQILPQEQQRPLQYCKGSYFSYKGPGLGHVQRLLYPCPDPTIAGLGTHVSQFKVSLRASESTTLASSR